MLGKNKAFPIHGCQQNIPHPCQQCDVAALLALRIRSAFESRDLATLLLTHFGTA
jgi:hypothetical protein